MNKALSWKFLIPFGIIWLLLAQGGSLALIGTISLFMGVIDAIRQLFKYYRNRKLTNNHERMDNPKI